MINGAAIWDTLRDHWLLSVKRETDTYYAICACGWTGENRPNFGAAIFVWTHHVRELSK
jgi:hypothetical protein